MIGSKKYLGSLLLIVLSAAGLAVCGFVFFRTAGTEFFDRGGRLPVYDNAPGFTLTERSGRPLTQSALEGKVWVADFIFTRCMGPCPFMSLRAQEILAKVPGFTMVSFTSDPAYDTPEVLARYADRYKADPDRWLFLTGPKEEMSRIAKEFKFGGIDAPDMHSTRFILVDQQGQVRGYYDSNDPEHLARLKRDIRSLN